MPYLHLLFRRSFDFNIPALFCEIRRVKSSASDSDRLHLLPAAMIDGWNDRFPQYISPILAPSPDIHRSRRCTRAAVIPRNRVTRECHNSGAKNERQKQRILSNTDAISFPLRFLPPLVLHATGGQNHRYRNFRKKKKSSLAIVRHRSQSRQEDLNTVSPRAWTVRDDHTTSCNARSTLRRASSSRFTVVRITKEKAKREWREMNVKESRRDGNREKLRARIGRRKHSSMWKVGKWGE